MWVISEDPIADAQQAAAFANAFPSSGDLDLHQEVRRLRQELAITQGEVVDTRHREEMSRTQVRQEDGQHICERLSSQAREVVTYHERTARAAASQARHEARDTVAVLKPRPQELWPTPLT